MAKNKLTSDVTIPIARQAFSEISACFPDLKIIENPNDPVEISLTIPVQKGLSEKVWLCLQNLDELHFRVERFQHGWFPCTQPEKVRVYVDAVCGFLSGKNRLFTQYRGNRIISQKLQKPEAGIWQTIATGYNLLSWVPFPWKKTYKETFNTDSQQ